MSIKSITLLTTLVSATLVNAQPLIFTANHTETSDGGFNAGRILSNSSLDGNHGPDQQQWNNRGNSGLAGDGRIWQGFSRYKMFDRDLYNQIVAADVITWTTGLYQKEINRQIDAENGGHDVDWYLALDPSGTIIPSGELPSFEYSWDWANQFGNGWENTVYLGRVLQSEPSATDAEKDVANGRIPADSPAMRITFDVTDALKDWIDQGLLTEDSTIAFGNVQRAAVISDDQGNPLLNDPNLYVHNQMVFEVANAFLTLDTSDVEMGPGPFAEYEVVNGFVDTGSWLGWVYVAHYPWSYIVDLGKYVYVPDSGGWLYIPN